VIASIRTASCFCARDVVEHALVDAFLAQRRELRFGEFEARPSLVVAADDLIGAYALL
jgi:hypothetical protein